MQYDARQYVRWRITRVRGGGAATDPDPDVNLSADAPAAAGARAVDAGPEVGLIEFRGTRGDYLPICSSKCVGKSLSGHGAWRCYDGSGRSSWRSRACEPIIFGLLGDVYEVGSYRFMTGDVAARDPVQWTMEVGRTIDGPWRVLHKVSSAADITPDRRNAWTELMGPGWETGDASIARVRLNPYDVLGFTGCAPPSAGEVEARYRCLALQAHPGIDLHHLPRFAVLAAAYTAIDQGTKPGDNSPPTSPVRLDIQAAALVDSDSDPGVPSTVGYTAPDGEGGGADADASDHFCSFSARPHRIRNNTVPQPPAVTLPVVDPYEVFHRAVGMLWRLPKREVALESDESDADAEEDVEDDADGDADVDADANTAAGDAFTLPSCASEAAEESTDVGSRGARPRPPSLLTQPHPARCRADRDSASNGGGGHKQRIGSVSFVDGVVVRGGGADRDDDTPAAAVGGVGMGVVPPLPTLALLSQQVVQPLRATSLDDFDLFLSSDGAAELAALFRPARRGEKTAVRAVCIRHGMSFQNDSLATARHVHDPALNKVGLLQARRLGGILRALDIFTTERVLIVASPYRRTIQSALEALAVHPGLLERVDIRVTPLAAEHVLHIAANGTGDDKGSTADELRALFPAATHPSIDFTPVDDYCRDRGITDGAWWRHHARHHGNETCMNVRKRADQLRAWLGSQCYARTSMTSAATRQEGVSNYVQEVDTVLVWSHGGLLCSAFGRPSYIQGGFRVFDLFADGTARRCATGEVLRAPSASSSPTSATSAPPPGWVNVDVAEGSQLWVDSVKRCSAKVDKHWVYCIEGHYDATPFTAITRLSELRRLHDQVKRELGKRVYRNYELHGLFPAKIWRYGLADAAHEWLTQLCVVMNDPSFPVPVRDAVVRALVNDDMDTEEEVDVFDSGACGMDLPSPRKRVYDPYSYLVSGGGLADDEPPTPVSPRGPLRSARKRLSASNIMTAGPASPRGGGKSARQATSVSVSAFPTTRPRAATAPDNDRTTPSFAHGDPTVGGVSNTSVNTVQTFGALVPTGESFDSDPAMSPRMSGAVASPCPLMMPCTTGQDVEWVPDELSSKCHLCRAAFTMVRRRHHCRKCGTVVCNKCSRYKLHVLGGRGSQRVCKSCWDMQQSMAHFPPSLLVFSSLQPDVSGRYELTSSVNDFPCYVNPDPAQSWWLYFSSRTGKWWITKHKREIVKNVGVMCGVGSTPLDVLSWYVSSKPSLRAAQCSTRDALAYVRADDGDNADDTDDDWYTEGHPLDTSLSVSAGDCADQSDPSHVFSSPVSLQRLSSHAASYPSSTSLADGL